MKNKFIKQTSIAAKRMAAGLECSKLEMVKTPRITDLRKQNQQVNNFVTDEVCKQSDKQEDNCNPVKPPANTENLTTPIKKSKEEPLKSPPQVEQEVIIFSDNHNLDDYVIGKQIGQGAYANVYLGFHKKVNKKVALKIYFKDKMKELSRKKSVRREIKLMKRLNHPNIAKLYDAIETD